MGRPLVVAWAEADTVAALQQRFRRARDARSAQRLHALWLLREGQSVRGTAAVVAADERTVGVWLRWYRAGGVDELLQHRGVGKGRAALLTAAQQEALRAHLGTGAVYRALDAVAWVEQQYQVTYTRGGMYSLLHRLTAHPKVPRPHNPKSTPEEQTAWKKGAPRRPEHGRDRTRTRRALGG
jgi:transposase